MNLKKSLGRRKPPEMKGEGGLACLPGGACGGVAELLLEEVDGVNMAGSKESRKVQVTQYASHLVPQVPFQPQTNSLIFSFVPCRKCTKVTRGPLIRWL